MRDTEEAAAGGVSPGPGTSPPLPSWEIALHEAGHAVAAMLLGSPYGCAVFSGNAERGPGGVAGEDERTHAQPPALNYTPERLSGVYDGMDARAILILATIFAAGDVALSLGHCPRTLRPSGDRMALYEMATAFMGGSDHMTIRSFVELSEANAARILGPVFFKVEAVARELQRRGRLTAADVKQIFDSVRGNLPNDPERF